MMHDVVAALPFLPQGKGGLILILGGMAALFLAMLWLSVTDPTSARRRARARPAGGHPIPRVRSSAKARRGRQPGRRPGRTERPLRTERAATRAQAGPPPQTREVPYGGRAARTVADAAGGAATMRSAGPAFAADIREAVLRLGLGPVEVWAAQEGRCVVLVQGCRSCLRPGPPTCDAERRAIEQTVQIVHSRASVAESACQARGRGRCVFEVLRQGGP